MNAITNTAAFATITSHFESYQKTTTEQTATDGFVSWAWETRKQILADLKASNFNLDAEIVYSISQQAQIDGEIEVPSEQEAAAWLAYHRDDLITALVESMA